MPTAKPTGHRLGAGTCGFSSAPVAPARSPALLRESRNRLPTAVDDVNDVAAAASERPRPSVRALGRRRCRTRPSGGRRARRISALISISGGHSRAPSSGPFAVASIPSLPPKNWQRRRVVEVVERALGEQRRRASGRRWRRRRRRPARSRARRRARRRRRPPSTGESIPRPQIACMTFCAWPGNALRIETMHAVVERARDRQVVVDDLGHGHADRRQEDPLGRLAEPRVLLRRLADDDRRVDRVAAHRQRGDVEDRERLGGRVVAGVVAERPLRRPRRPARRSPRARSPRSRAPRGRPSSPFTSSTGSPLRKPASMSSSMCFGSGALAE